MYVCIPGYCTVRVLHECHVPVCVHQGTEYYMYWLPGTGSLHTCTTIVEGTAVGYTLQVLQYMTHDMYMTCMYG